MPCRRQSWRSRWAGSRQGGDRALHREGIDDLGLRGGVLGVNPSEEGQHIAEARGSQPR